jgi:hypothetical protein
MAGAARSSGPGKTFGVVSDPGLGGTLRRWLMHPGPLEPRLETLPEYRAVVDVDLSALQRARA